ncbi:MAG TPA: glycoside hydrolase family 38 C-terminal domain-containing protein [Acidimicrobiales bacterium]|nr:glycoside hydrolase family 38 C-terminal domain-containing protein [Acidimicrobiales bacterium]
MAAEPADIEAFLREVVAPALYPNRAPLGVAAHHVGGEPIPFVAAASARFDPFEVGGEWGPMWDTTWFRFTGDVPGGWSDAVALIHLGGDEIVGFSAEGLAWTTGGSAVQGLHHRHREVGLAGVRDGDRIEFLVEAAANPIPPWHLRDWPDLVADYTGKPLYRLEQAELAEPDREVEGLYVDMKVLLEAAARIPDRRDAILSALKDASARFDASSASTVRAVRDLLRPLLDRRSGDGHRVTAVGHAHIDSAWLWPVRETRRKCVRTFANQLRLMERYPDHRFACSQAAQYQWIRDEHGDLYEQIKTRVSEGRWEPVGGMWVEADSNVPSGESLVRQLVHGKRFFLEEFGVETSELWIPDVFGYSAALPQIAVQAGVSSIVTQKMSWNDTNVFPHTTFWWQGHDGSRILAHFPPADTYNGSFSVAEVAACRDNHKDRDRADSSLYAFGYGDGGGGPTARMLERAARLSDLEGLPRVAIGTVAGFLASVDLTRLSTWNGELYLEAHRATLTTHSDVKAGNRRGEEALRAAEMWSVAAGIDRTAELDRTWKLLLFNQFHDIIPGSSISWVYKDARADYAEVMRVADLVIDEAQREIVTEGDGWVVFNRASSDRLEVVDCDSRPAIARAPACGWATVEPLDPEEVRVELHSSGLGTAAAGDDWMENAFLRVAWDSSGLLTSVWDRKADREVLAPGERGNLFQVHEDYPIAFDAWDVDREYLDAKTDLTAAESVEVVEAGPVRAAVRVVRRFGESMISQTMSLTAGCRRLEFHTEVDWQENHRFLKVAFPVAVRSTRATYEIQHGHVERPTVENTTWDKARFEVCAHRWADLSEPGYGVALINDCKYGYDIRGHVMRLSLLRAPGYPDPTADRGKHQFGYALLPHAGDLRDARVPAEAECFNLPLAPRRGVVAGEGRLVELDRQGVSIEAVKWADDGDGLIVRLCEIHGSRGPVRMALNHPHGPVWRADLLERNCESLEVVAGQVRLSLRPFELVTLRFSAPRP